MLNWDTVRKTGAAPAAHWALDDPVDHECVQLRPCQHDLGSTVIERPKSIGRIGHTRRLSWRDCFHDLSAPG
jgi:hypothetical protein